MRSQHLLFGGSAAGGLSRGWIASVLVIPEAVASATPGYAVVEPAGMPVVAGPQIAFASRCEGLPLDADPEFTWLAAHGRDGARFVLLRGGQTPGGASRELRYLMRLDPDWRVYAMG